MRIQRVGLGGDRGKRVPLGDARPRSDATMDRCIAESTVRGACGHRCSTPPSPRTRRPPTSRAGCRGHPAPLRAGCRVRCRCWRPGERHARRHGGPARKDRWRRGSSGRLSFVILLHWGFNHGLVVPVAYVLQHLVDIDGGNPQHPQGGRAQAQAGFDRLGIGMDCAGIRPRPNWLRDRGRARSPAPADNAGATRQPSVVRRHGCQR